MSLLPSRLRGLFLHISNDSALWKKDDEDSDKEMDDYFEVIWKDHDPAEDEQAMNKTNNQPSKVKKLLFNVRNKNKENRKNKAEKMSLMDEYKKLVSLDTRETQRSEKGEKGSILPSIETKELTVTITENKEEDGVSVAEDQSGKLIYPNTYEWTNEKNGKGGDTDNRDDWHKTVFHKTATRVTFVLIFTAAILITGFLFTIGYYKIWEYVEEDKMNILPANNVVQRVIRVGVILLYFTIMLVFIVGCRYLLRYIERKLASTGGDYFGIRRTLPPEISMETFIQKEVAEFSIDIVE